jgi:hypothetical protein
MLDLSRQTYLLYTRFEANPQAMINDDGLCNNLYEIGPGAGLIMPSKLMPFYDSPTCN